MGNEPTQTNAEVIPRRPRIRRMVLEEVAAYPKRSSHTTSPGSSRGAGAKIEAALSGPIPSRHGHGSRI
jgi:hypothetical protein